MVRGDRDRHGFAAREARNSERTDGSNPEEEEPTDALKRANKNLEELIQKSQRIMNDFPTSGGWLKRWISDAVKDKKRVYAELETELSFINFPLLSSKRETRQTRERRRASKEKFKERVRHLQSSVRELSVWVGTLEKEDFSTSSSDSDDDERNEKENEAIPENLEKEKILSDERDSYYLIFHRLEAAAGELRAQWDTDKSVNQDSDGDLESLQRVIKGRVVNVGIELILTLSGLSLLCARPKQIVRQIHLKNWILHRSDPKSKVVYLIDGLLGIADDLANDMIKDNAERDEDGEDLLSYDLLERFARAICCLQLIVSDIHQKQDVPERNRLARVERFLLLCEENLAAAKEVTNSLKGLLQRKETEEAFQKEMLEHINLYWNVEFWGL